MNVLTNKDNSMADIVGSDNRNVRQNTVLNNLINSELNATNRKKLVFVGVNGYKDENKNSLSGEYSKNVQPVNHNERLKIHLNHQTMLIFQKKQRTITIT